VKQFALLIQALASSTKTNDKLLALQQYFAAADSKDKVWVIALFTGKRPKRSVTSTLLKQWCIEVAQIPEWLFEECYHTVGDLAETIALLLPSTIQQEHKQPLNWYIEMLTQLASKEEAEKKKFIMQQWMQLNAGERFVFNKLITGGFRIGVSQKMMVNALAKTVQIPASTIAHQIMGNWDAAAIAFETLLSQSAENNHPSRPYPFYLAYALDDVPESLGQPTEWQAEWKWDGIRGQIIKRNDELFVWSRGEELMTDKFPEYQSLLQALPNGTVLDGEIIPAKNGQPMPFALLQTRIGRKNISKKQLQEVPIHFFAYDLLEKDGIDFREQPLATRRNELALLLQQLPEHLPIQLSSIVSFTSWQELAQIRTTSREHGAEGLMLKRKNSAYQVGRKVGDWWKWKIDPLTIDAVMIYAQKGHGRRSNLYTDYTFAVKDGDKLVSFTKAYSGLTDKEFLQVDAFVKSNSLEKFGPVRTVKPELVFEIAFEGIAASNRHKSGVALRFPRMLRWRKDKKVEDINTLADLKKLLQVYGK
jgi:DNA ligase-1